jgi:hypothetical protein
MVNSHPDLLKRYPSVKETLNNLEHEDVAERVQALTSRATSCANLRTNQAGSRPVIELTIANASSTGCDRASESDVLRQRGKVSLEKSVLTATRVAVEGNLNTRLLTGRCHIVTLHQFYSWSH